VNMRMNAYERPGTGAYANPVASKNTAMNGKVHRRRKRRPLRSTSPYAGREKRKLVTAKPQLYHSGVRGICSASDIFEDCALGEKEAP
jgi:hypothetical protein